MVIAITGALQGKTLLFSEEKRSKKDFYSLVPHLAGESLRPRSASKSLFASFSSEKEES
jgi:hypothetical protein